MPAAQIQRHGHHRPGQQQVRGSHFCQRPAGTLQHPIGLAPERSLTTAWPLNSQGITPTDFIDLWLPVTQYLERRGLVRSNRNSIHGQHCSGGGLQGLFFHTKASRPTIWCLPGSLLPEVIRRMIDNHVHRYHSPPHLRETEIEPRAYLLSFVSLQGVHSR